MYRLFTKVWVLVLNIKRYGDMYLNECLLFPGVVLVELSCGLFLSIIMDGATADETLYGAVTKVSTKPCMELWKLGKDEWKNPAFKHNYVL